MAYAPDRGDIVLLNLSPQAGSEMAGEYRCLVLSEARFSIATGYAVVSPITTKIKGSPFEVQIPPGLKAKGCVVASEIRTIDYMARGTHFLEKSPRDLVELVQDVACAIIGRPAP
ncbi:type II toxin-antitoxin system PemK/MazF family toxin [Azospirillum sp. ST 5-10]|uniref:type II toxin-antitoxin system PemK/MazF family toxin n=1 Tax=unclassified Azospirillum TaxID=2630922 RepID=UPI003F4A60AC